MNLSGPRVLDGDGTIVMPRRENVRYTGRRAGYHGGAALAEVTVPVLVLVRSADMAPQGWDPLPREQAAPPWWRPAVTPAAVVVEHASPTVGMPPKPRPSRTPRQPEGLFTDADMVTPEEEPSAAPVGLGDRVVSSEVYEAQRAYVRKARETKIVAAVIDELVAAAGTMSPAALAAAISASGRVRRNIDGFVATVQRLLNVEGYPVLGFIDGGHTVKLDETLLRGQFLPDREAR
ncbi:hypothetical protein ACFYPN_06900 [Streptomyces sp. NPDC005576]|uniref:hypothetical protein n=1 Tax=unclassified Streptomyces TaxID=2593676 RepID=UPI0033CB3D4E